MERRGIVGKKTYFCSDEKNDLDAMAADYGDDGLWSDL